MMIRVLAAAAMTLILPVSAQAQDARAASVIAESKAATGGAAWDAIDGSYEEGEQGGMPYRTWLDYRGYGMRFEASRGGVAMVQAFNGEAAWSSRGGSPAMVSRDPAMLGEVRVSAYISMNGFYFPERFPATLAWLRAETRDGASFDVISAAPAGSKPVELWFDRATHFLTRVVDNGGPGPVTMVASDYQRVDGVMVPMRIDILGPDGAIADTVRVTRVTFQRVPRSQFDPPQ